GEQTAAAITARHPAIELLVNNAGLSARSDFLSADPERIEEVIRVNYLGGIWCLRAFLVALEAGAPSHLVNVVSVAGTVAAGRSGPYTASKHAQLAFSRTIGPALRGRGIGVHTILPGFVETEGFAQRDRLPRALRRLVAEPEDVAARIVRAVERGRGESFVPRWYRVPSLLIAVTSTSSPPIMKSRWMPLRLTRGISDSSTASLMPSPSAMWLTAFSSSSVS